MSQSWRDSGRTEKEEERKVFYSFRVVILIQVR